MVKLMRKATSIVLSSTRFALITVTSTPVLFTLITFSTFLFSFAQGQDLSRRRTSNVCKSNEDCPNFAYCERAAGQLSNGQCVCSSGYIIMANNGLRECFPMADSIGGLCQFHEQCMITLSTDAECLQRRCRCRNGTHFDPKENSCYKSVRIGDFCRLTKNCIGKGSVCRDGVCRCPLGTHSNYDMTDCINDVQLGEVCSSHDECVADNTRCYDVCRCKVSHVMSKNATRCLKAAFHIYNNCTEDHQCTELIPHSECKQSNQTCMCREGYHEINYKCWVSVPLGRICEVDENCALIPNGICLDGRCICRNDLKIEDGVCSSHSNQLISHYFMETTIKSQRYFALKLLIFLIFIYGN